jgi:hypothetical protein
MGMTERSIDIDDRKIEEDKNEAASATVSVFFFACWGCCPW